MRLKPAPVQRHERVFQFNPERGWFRVDCTDQHDPVPDGATRYARQIIVGPAVGRGLELNIALTLFNFEPREWPPMHMGSTHAGINLTYVEVVALRDVLDSWLKRCS